jgi:hypothetical protein
MLRAGAPEREGWLLGSSPSVNGIKKKTDFVDSMISNVLYDLPLNENQPLKSADD